MEPNCVGCSVCVQRVLIWGCRLLCMGCVLKLVVLGNSLCDRYMLYCSLVCWFVKTVVCLCVVSYCVFTALNCFNCDIYIDVIV
jgi:hypothetical protein